MLVEVVVYLIHLIFNNIVYLYSLEYIQYEFYRKMPLFGYVLNWPIGLTQPTNPKS